MGLPAAPEDLSAAWLTETLRGADVIDASTRVSAVATERLGEGVGFIGVVARVTPAYEGGPGAPTLIAKFPSPDEGARALGNMYGLYEREVRFYDDIAGSAGLTTPRCYFSSWDPSSERSLLLLEDLAPHGRLGDQVGGCTGEHASLALAELAKFHAAWWRNPRMASIAWLQKGVDLVRASMTQAYPDAREPFLRDFGRQLAPDVAACVGDLHERVVRLLDEIEAEGSATIAHGDYRLDNMFFGGPDAPYRLAVIDWQSFNEGWGAYDLAYFLSGSLPAEERRTCEMDALRRYMEGLQAGGVRDYSFDELLLDYRRSLMVYLAIFVVNGATLERSNERAVQLFDVIFERLNAAIVDLDAIATLPPA